MYYIRVCVSVGMRVIQNNYRGKMVKEVDKKGWQVFCDRIKFSITFSMHPSPCSEFVEIYRNR